MSTHETENEREPTLWDKLVFCAWVAVCPVVAVLLIPYGMWLMMFDSGKPDPDSPVMLAERERLAREQAERQQLEWDEYYVALARWKREQRLTPFPQGWQRPGDPL
jgi:hypothetical protein